MRTGTWAVISRCERRQQQPQLVVEGDRVGGVP